MRLAVVTGLVLASSPAFAQTFVQLEQVVDGQVGVVPAPEIALAVSDTRQLEIAGGNVAIALRGSTPAVNESTAQFWAAAGVTATPGEHRAVFDAISRHWFVSADDATHRYLAVSANDDPLSGWLAITLPPATGTRLAVDPLGVYLVGTHGGQSDIVVIPLADALAGITTNVAQLTAPELDLVPAIDRDGDATSPQVLVGRGTNAQTGNTTIDGWAIAWSNGAPMLGGPVSFDLGAAFRDPPPNAVQPPGSPLLPTGTGHIRSASVVGGQLFAIAATQIGGRAGAFAVQLDLSSGTVSALDQIGQTDADLINPEIAADTSGNVGIVLTEVSSTTGPQTMLTGRNQFFFGSPLAQLFPAAGTGAYSCAPQNNVSSYAPYASISPDPSFGFWADAALAGTGDCGFHTTMIQFDIPVATDVSDDVFFEDDGGLPVDPVGSKPLAGCCSASSGASSLVLSALVIALARARRRVRRSQTP